MITLRDVHYTYPGETAAALHGVTLEIAEGEICALVGPNGAGKSTLCYTIGGFVPHYYHGELRGEVIVDGRNTVEHPLGELVKHTGLVFHNPLNQISGARFTVREELAFGLENLGVPRGAMLARIEQVLDQVGIAHLAERSPFELSGGQQQRVALASILVMGPRVLLLDEPTSQLDPLGTKEVFAAIKALSRSGVTVVLAEHKPELIAEFADRVVVLHQGQVWQQGPPRAVLADPGLDEIGVSVSRYTQAARAGLERGVWPVEQPLPVTLDEAVAGFGGAAHSGNPASEAARRGER
ncbi:MAG: ABC transporter ATP-binding protein [Chloroflexi bacterium]|nr:ABC transporter ATP-binding protein [Chloroflexota bacterium]